MRAEVRPTRDNWLIKNKHAWENLETRDLFKHACSASFINARLHQYTEFYTFCHSIVSSFCQGENLFTTSGWLSKSHQQSISLWLPLRDALFQLSHRLLTNLSVYRCRCHSFRLLLPICNLTSKVKAHLNHQTLLRGIRKKTKPRSLVRKPSRNASLVPSALFSWPKQRLRSWLAPSQFGGPISPNW